MPYEVEMYTLPSDAIKITSPQDPHIKYYYIPGGPNEKGRVVWETEANLGPNANSDENGFTTFYRLVENPSKRNSLIEANRSKLNLTNPKYEGKYDVGETAVRNSKTTLTYPINSNSSDFVLFEFYKYAPPWKSDIGDYDQKKNNQYIKSKLQSISLYMPEDISTGFRANWTGKSLSNVASNALRSAGAASGTEFGNALRNGATAIGQFFETAAPLAGAIALQKATTKLTGDSLTLDDIFGGIGGQVLNPNTELLYNGPDLRNFTLNFRLVPRNIDKEEATILDIIKTFKKAMLPAASASSNAQLDSIRPEGEEKPLAFIGVPDLVKVTFFVQGQISTTLPRFKMCSIISTDVNYTPDGSYATYTSGNPVAYDLSISFQETKVVYRENIGNGVN